MSYTHFFVSARSRFLQRDWKLSFSRLNSAEVYTLLAHTCTMSHSLSTPFRRSAKPDTNRYIGTYADRETYIRHRSELSCCGSVLSCCGSGFNFCQKNWIRIPELWMMHSCKSKWNLNRLWLLFNLKLNILLIFECFLISKIIINDKFNVFRRPFSKFVIKFEPMGPDSSLRFSI
jgi:hypothetical protein